jgi:hypothetical protein
MDRKKIEYKITNTPADAGVLVILYIIQSHAPKEFQIFLR